MSDDIHRKRAYVSDMYPSKRWKTKVKHMSDIQVTAIYLKEQAKGFPSKPKKENNDDIPF
jgi:hypothetical protein